MLFRTTFSLIVCTFFLTVNPVQGQEELGALCDSWSRCNKEMTEKYKALNDGDPTPGLTEEYRDLVDQANDLIKAMRKQSIVELKARPGDGQVIRTMLGIMVHDAQEGRDGMVLGAGQALIEAKVNPKYFEQAANIERLELSQKHVFEELVVRHRETMKDDLPRVKLNTTAGEIVIELFENEAPNTVRNFVSLVESGHYTNKLFHRVIENFMAQGGGFETEGIGSGGPGYQIECECKAPDARRNFTGTISMAHAGRDTGGSQFFLNFKYNKFLDQNHTVFGRIVAGQDVLDKIERTEISINGQERPIEKASPDKIVTAEVVRKRDHSYRVRKKGEPELPEEPEPKKEEPAEKEMEKEEPDGKDESEKEESDEPELEEKESDDSEMKEEEKASEEAAKEEKESEGEEKKSEQEETDSEPAKEEPAKKDEGSGESKSEGGESETPESEEGEESGSGSDEDQS